MSLSENDYSHLSRFLVYRVLQKYLLSNERTAANDAVCFMKMQMSHYIEEILNFKSPKPMRTFRFIIALREKIKQTTIAEHKPSPIVVRTESALFHEPAWWGEEGSS